MDAARLIKNAALENGASLCGIAGAGPLVEYGRFSGMLEALPPSLSYLSREPEKRKSAAAWFPAARSVLVCAYPIAGRTQDPSDGRERILRSGRKLPHPEFFEAGNRKIAGYAMEPDYHAAVKEKLGRTLEKIAALFPAAAGKIFVDTSPVLEKELGRLAGLGFRGRNTLLVNPERGSFFVLGGIALAMELPPDAPCAGSCGDCELCVRACPTGALKDGRLDAAKCVSYLTTQAREKLPPLAAQNSGGFAYGCDICQDVCPFNRRSGAWESAPEK